MSDDAGPSAGIGGAAAGGAAADTAAAAAVAAVLREQQAMAEAERRRLRRRVFWWRFAAILLILFIAFGVIFSEGEERGDQIARVSVSGLIIDDVKRDALFAKIADEDRVKAVIVRIDSPGGTTVGGEAIYESLRAVAAKKPVVAVMGEVAASAAYITALAADHIVARGNTITASVGVIFTAPNFSGALDSLGVEMLEVKSGAQKAEPSPYKPVDQTTLEAERVLVQDSFDWFLGLVRERRAMDEAALGQIRDGRILTGRMALEAGLVDQLGGEAEALSWLAAERDVSASLPVVDRSTEEPDASLTDVLLDDLFGEGSIASAARRLLPGPKLMSLAD